METKIINDERAKEMLVERGVTMAEYNIGRGASFTKVMTGLFLLNGLIYAHRYGLGDNKKFGALVLLGSYPLAYYVSRYGFGDKKLADLGEQH